MTDDTTRAGCACMVELRAWLSASIHEKSGDSVPAGDYRHHEGFVDGQERAIEKLDALTCTCQPNDAGVEGTDAAKWADAVCKAAEAVDAKLTRYGSGDWVESYVMPAGPWHLLLGLVRGGLWPEYTNDKLRADAGVVAALREWLEIPHGKSYSGS